MDNAPVFVSFYTQDEYYSSFAKKMIHRINELNLNSLIKFDYDFELYTKKPTDTWSSITFKKPEYIRKWLDKYKSIIWIDIDSTIHRLPIMPQDKVIDCPYDLAAIDRGTDGSVYDYLWLVKSTPITKSFFEDVTDKIKKEYVNSENHLIKEGGDHDAVLKILNEYKKKHSGFYGSIGFRNFGSSTGWATFGISGNEPVQSKKQINNPVIKNNKNITTGKINININRIINNHRNKKIK